MKIPITAALKIGKDYGCQQVILFAWDGEQTQVVTWGESLDDCYCSQAADGANKIKKNWDWPLSNDQPSSVMQLQKKFDDHVKAVGEFLQELYMIMVDPLSDGVVPIQQVMSELRQSALRSRELGNGAPPPTP